MVFNSFGESSIDFTLYYWFDSGQTGLLEATDGGLKAVKRAFEEAQIEIQYFTVLAHAKTQRRKVKAASLGVLGDLA